MTHTDDNRRDPQAQLRVMLLIRFPSWEPYQHDEFVDRILGIFADRDPGARTSTVGQQEEWGRNRAALEARYQEHLRLGPERCGCLACRRKVATQ